MIIKRIIRAIVRKIQLKFLPVVECYHCDLIFGNYVLNYYSKLGVFLCDECLDREELLEIISFT